MFYEAELFFIDGKIQNFCGGLINRQMIFR